MPNFRTLLADAQALQDDLKLLEAFAEVVAKWPELAAQIEDLPSAEALLDRVAADVQSDTVGQAFAAVGAEELHTRLKAALARVKTAEGKIPDEVKLLLRKTSSFKETRDEHPGLVAWRILDKDQAIRLAPEYSLNVGGKAEVELEAGDAGFNAGGSGAPVLRFKAGGSLTGKAGAKLPFQGGALDASASASTALSMEGFFEVTTPDSLYAADVVRAAGELPNPFDFDAVWGAFQATDLAGLAYHFDGATDGRIKVTLADGFSLGHGVTAALAATVSVGMSLKAQHSLMLRRGPRRDDGVRQIHARLTRRRIDSRDVKGSLGLTVDVSSLTTRVHEVLKEAIGKWDEVLADVKPFLTPGSLLKSKAPGLIEGVAAKLVADDGLRAALVRDLSGAVGVDPTDDSKLADWLQGELEAAIDRSGVVALAEGAAQRALGELKRGLPAFAQAQFDAVLQPHLEALSEKVQEEVKAAVDEAVEKVGVKRIGSALKAAGARAQKHYDDADEALEGVREIVAKYDALFKKVLAAAEAATKAKITATFMVEETRAGENELQFGGVILDASESARAVFEALTQGRTERLVDILEGQSVAGFSLDRSSSLRRYTKSVSKRGFEVVLLNFGGVTGTELLTTETEALVDGDGNVQVDSKVRLEKHFKGPREERKTAFAEVSKLLLARDANDGDGEVTRTLELGVSVVHEDKSLKRSEVTGFIKSLETAKLVASDIPGRAEAQFNRWLPPGSDHLRADIAAKLWLKGDAARRLLHLEHRIDGTLSHEARIGILKTGLAAWAGVRQVDLQVFNAGAGKALNRYLNKPTGTKMTPFEVVLELYDKKLDDTMADFRDSKGDDLLEDFREVARPLYNLVRLIQLMGDVYRSDPQVWDLKRYQKAQEAIGASTKGWLMTNTKGFFWIGAEVHPRVIALFQVISRLAGAPQPGAMTLVMTNRPKDGEPETIALA